jgi:hypothetical protein
VRATHGSCNADQVRRAKPVRPIHDRMPVVLITSEAWHAWLRPSVDSAAARAGSAAMRGANSAAAGERGDEFGRHQSDRPVDELSQSQPAASPRTNRTGRTPPPRPGDSDSDSCLRPRRPDCRRGRRPVAEAGSSASRREEERRGGASRARGRLPFLPCGPSAAPRRTRPQPRDEGVRFGPWGQLLPRKGAVRGQPRAAGDERPRLGRGSYLWRTLP